MKFTELLKRIEDILWPADNTVEEPQESKPLPKLTKPISECTAGEIWQYILALLADKHGTLELPDHEVEALARTFLPDILAFFQSEEGKKEFEEWKKEREKNACPETVFICPVCKQSMHLPQCSCGYKFNKTNKIWQLSDAPDMVLSGDGDKYVGYEHIGENYSGTRKYMIEEADALVAKEIAAETGTGIFLDLACGDGCFTVPCASLGVKTIAGDISNAMLKVLQEKADHNHISLDTVTLCRMNALDIPLADETVDTVIANSVLHLISNPEKVLSEIYRVLKPSGCFLCIDDLPGKNIDTSFDNSKYSEIVNFIYSDYWQKLNAMGIQPVKYSWKFNRSGACDALFKTRKETNIQMSGISKISISDSFLPRFSGRGFSDQVDVPEDLHRMVLEQTLTEAERLFGENFGCATCTSVREDILVTKYYK